MALRDFGFTIVPVRDLERSTLFYRDILGLPVRSSTADWVQFETHGTPLVLRRNAERSGGKPTHLTFRVDELDTECARLKEKGVDANASPVAVDSTKQAILQDPDGNTIDLIEWKGGPWADAVTRETVVNDIIMSHPETMEVFEEHGIRICGGCLVLLNAPVRQTADYSGLGSAEAGRLVQELNEKVEELAHSPSRT